MAQAQVVKSIVFISVDAEENGKPISLSGTGFIVAIRDARLGPNGLFQYLVTNRHVAQAIEQNDQGHCAPLPITATYVTMNLNKAVNGTRLQRRQLPLVPGHGWHYPQDEGVDLAVMYFPAAGSMTTSIFPSKTYLQQKYLKAIISCLAINS
jgi:hypothetical protein